MIVLVYNAENIDFGENENTGLLIDSSAFKVSDDKKTILTEFGPVPKEINHPQIISQGYNQDAGVSYLIDEDAKAVNVVLYRETGDLGEIKIELGDEEKFNIANLQFNLEIVPSNNRVNISGTYINNTEYTITQVIITYVDEMTNNTEYFGSYETVLPGETSPISKGDGFDNMDAKMELMNPIKYEIKAVKPNGNEVYITYDVKLDKYQVR